VISIYTLDTFDKNYVNAGLTFGSYNFQQYQSTIGFSSGKNSFIVQGTKTNTDGFRTQSGFKNDNINLRMKRSISDKTTLNVHINYTDSPYAGDAGGLTLDEVKVDRQQARSRNLDFQTHESIDQFKSGLNLNHQWGQSSISTYGFYSSRNFNGLLPFEFGGIVDLGRNYFGFGSHYTLKSTKENSFGSLGFFALNHFTSGNFLLRTGIRYDRNKLEVADQFLTNGDQSDANTLTAFNPSIGIGYELLKNQHLFANFSTSFETPVLSELSSNPTGSGGFNQDLEAQKAKNIEIGYKLEGQKDRLDITLFHINTTNDIVPFEIEEFQGRTFYKNAGSTIRKGVEISYSIHLMEALLVSTSYTYSDFQYEEYTTPSGDFQNNRLPGIPKHMGSLSFNYQNKKGIKIRLNNQYVGKLYANDANSVSDKGYLNSNLNIGYKIKTKTLSLTPYLGVNNLFDVTYNDNIRINAFGGRYYEPAPGIGIFAGIRAAQLLN
jgi:iron complex outermembrane receptor protein